VNDEHAGRLVLQCSEPARVRWGSQTPQNAAGSRRIPGRSWVVPDLEVRESGVHGTAHKNGIALVCSILQGRPRHAQGRKRGCMLALIMYFMVTTSEGPFSILLKGSWKDDVSMVTVGR
jgi:hypothetical protein